LPLMCDDRRMKTTIYLLTLLWAACSSAMQAGDDVRFVKAQTQVYLICVSPVVSVLSIPVIGPVESGLKRHERDRGFHDSVFPESCGRRQRTPVA